MFRSIAITAFTLFALMAVAGVEAQAAGKKELKTATFKVTVTNVSDRDGIVAQDNTRYPFALSPGFYFLSDKELFRAGKRASLQLESLAEDGNPEPFYKKFLTRVGSLYLGIFNKPVGSDMASPILPGGSFEFSFYATQGQKFNLVTMFGQSNDLFYAPDQAIDLFDKNGDPISGDITRSFRLWDAGTEVNQAPGIGADQGPRQKGPNTGIAENGVVKLVDDGFSYPETSSVLRVTIAAQ